MDTQILADNETKMNHPVDPNSRICPVVPNAFF